MLAYTRLQLQRWLSDQQAIYAKAGLNLDLSDDGFPPGFPVAAFINNSTAATALSAVLIEPLQHSLPSPPTDWTKNDRYQQLVSISNINQALALLCNWQSLPADERASPIVQYIYPQVLALALAQTADIRYESVEQAMQLRDSLHSHIDYIQRQLFADQHSSAINMALSGQVISGLRDLMSIVDEAAEQQLATLPHVISIQLMTEQPLLCLAWSQHKDSSQADSIRARNSEIRHPLFVPPDVTLEILK